MIESIDPISMFLSGQQVDSAERSKVHEELVRSSSYQTELAFLRKTVRDLLYSVRLCEVVASRWNHFQQNYLMPTYVDEIVEAAITAQLAIENGALNPARRELRYMLEVAVNVSYVDELSASRTFDDRIEFYRSNRVNKANVDHIKELPLRMLGEARTTFVDEVVRAWVKSSNYVHLTKRRIDEKLRLRAQGVNLGFETLEMLREATEDVHRACSIVMVLTFETIGPTFTGDILVNALDQREDWVLHASGYIAAVNAHFDYKEQRQCQLRELIQRRNGRIRFPVPAST